MQPVVQAVLRSWSIPPVATFALLFTALAYLRGCWLLRRAGYPHLPAWRIASFTLGLFALWFALASPFDTFSSFVLTAHMLQHMILMMVAPPLLLLGEPLIPIVRGMPRFAAREFAGPFLNWSVAMRLGMALTNPVVALLLMGTVMFVWHVPGPYELAVRSSAWHEVEHSCFFFVSLIFWWPVVQPWPSRAQWPRWAMVPYLVIADLQNTVLSAVLVFSDRALYPSYAAGPSLFGFPPQEDQAAAGAIMWVVGSLVFIVPAILIAVQCLSRRTRQHAAAMVQRADTSLASSVLTDAEQRPWLVRAFGKQLSLKSIEAVSFVVLFAATAAGFVALSKLSTDDDDQVLRLAQQSGPLIVAVYGQPGDLPPGPASFAVLVQDRTSHEVLLDSNVTMSLRNVNGVNAKPQQVRATPDDENKLLYSADVDLESAGAWTIEVAVQHGSDHTSISLPIEVTKPEAGSAFPWSYIVVTTFAAILIVTYLWRHRRRASAAIAAPVT